MRKRLLLTLVLMCYFSALGFAQFISKPDLFIKGGKEGKNYAIIIKSELDSKEQLKRTLELLNSYGLVEDSKVDKLDDKLTQISVPFTLSLPIMPFKYMGMPTPLNPMLLEGDLSFQFESTRKEIIIGLENLECAHYVTSQKFMDVKGKIGINAKPEDLTPDEKLVNAYQSDYGLVTMGSSFISKLLILVAGGLNAFAKVNTALSDYFADTYKRYNEIYYPMRDRSLIDLVPHSRMLDYSKERGYHKYSIQLVEKMLSDGRIVGLPISFWNKEVRTIVDNLFKLTAHTVEGEIVAIQEDGKITWENVEGKVLPTDPKLRKKYIKKGMEY